MGRTFLVSVILALVSSLVIGSAVTTAQEEPEFVLGFAEFHDMMPDVVGNPLENERHDLIGNGFQQTENGLLVWNRLDNSTDFTDGSTTIILSEQGLLERSNEELFEFEIVREQIEQQLEADIQALLELQPEDLEAQIEALVEQFEAQLEAQLEQQPEQEQVEEQPEQAPGPATFSVTIENLTPGQPFSPPIAATHQVGVRLFQVGATASDELAAVARDGNSVPLFNLVNGAAGVTQAVTIGGVEPGESASFEIQANPGDVFSLATMLGCTNDGFTGVDSMSLPEAGSVVFTMISWDAGREQNTELIEDLPDSCSIPVGEATNRNAEVATIPFDPIAPHPGILGIGGERGLDPAIRGWTEPVIQITIERISG